MEPTTENLPASRRTLLKSTAAGVGALAGAAAVTAATAAPAAARSRGSHDFLLLIEGIEGESNSPGHHGEIEIESFSWGATNSGTQTGGGAGSGKVQFQDFHFVVESGKASPQLFLACATGKHFPRAVLTARSPGGRQDFYVIEMEELLVSSFQSGGSSGAGVPTDQISLNFARIEFPQR